MIIFSARVVDAVFRATRG